jgi:hypothetical protein
VNIKEKKIEGELKFQISNCFLTESRHRKVEKREKGEKCNDEFRRFWTGGNRNWRGAV